MAEQAPTHEQRELRLLRSYRTRGDRAAYDEFVRRLSPLVRATARKYAGRGEEIEDLVQVGMLGLVKAIEGFDFSRRGRFVSYAGPTISGEIKRHFRDHLWSVHVPRSMQELQAKVTAEEARIEREGRTATVAELARRLDVDEAQVQRAQIASRAFRASSLERRVGDDDESRPTDVGELDRGYERVETSALLDDAMSVLDDREREIVQMRYVDGLLQREIASSIGISQMQVSRILSRAARRMREHLAQLPQAA